MIIPATLRAAKEVIADIYFAALRDAVSPRIGEFQIPQLTGVGIEFRAGANGALLDDLVVVLYLTEAPPGLPAEIATPSFGVLPSLRVQWRVTGLFRALSAAPLRVRERPASLGLSIGPRRFQEIAGTLGAIVQLDADPSKRFILSCNHVLALNNDHFANPGDRSVLQPAGSDDLPGINGNAIGQIDSLEPFCVLRQVPSRNPGDFALARVLANDQVNPRTPVGMPRLSSPKPLGIEEFLRNHSTKTLFKAGRSTGVTKGKLKAPDTTFAMSFGDHMHIRCGFERQLLVVPKQAGDRFAKEGDSGALVLTEDGLAVGLIFATDDDGDTVICPLDGLFSNLGLSFVLAPGR